MKGVSLETLSGLFARVETLYTMRHLAMPTVNSLSSSRGSFDNRICMNMQHMNQSCIEHIQHLDTYVDINLVNWQTVQRQHDQRQSMISPLPSCLFIFVLFLNFYYHLPNSCLDTIEVQPQNFMIENLAEWHLMCIGRHGPKAGW